MPEETPDVPKETRGRPPKVKGPTIQLRVIHGTFTAPKGKYYGPGDTFECPEKDALMHLEQGDVERV